MNAVNYELSRLKSESCSTSQYIVNLWNSLLNLEEPLLLVNGLEHLKTLDKVDFLVEKFDERTQHEWEYYRSKQSGHMTDFLLFFSIDMILAGQLSLESIHEILRFHPRRLVVALSMELQQISTTVSSAQYGSQKMDTILAVIVDIQHQKGNPLDTVSCITQTMNLSPLINIVSVFIYHPLMAMTLALIRMIVMWFVALMAAQNTIIEVFMVAQQHLYSV